MHQFNSAHCNKEIDREAELDNEIDDVIEEAETVTDGLEEDISVYY